MVRKHIAETVKDVPAGSRGLQHHSMCNQTSIMFLLLYCKLVNVAHWAFNKVQNSVKTSVVFSSKEAKKLVVLFRSKYKCVKGPLNEHLYHRSCILVLQVALKWALRLRRDMQDLVPVLCPRNAKLALRR